MTYKTSRDYERLFELAKSGVEVPCWLDVDYRDGQPPLRHMRCCRKTFYGNAVEVGSHGVCESDVSADSGMQKFVGHCNRTNLEFIDPASQERRKIWHSPEEKPKEGAECIFIKKNDAAMLAVCDDGYNLWDRGWPAGYMDDVIKWAYVRDLEGME